MRYLLLLVILSCQASYAQICIRGITKDADSKEILPFVNIGIMNKNAGTISDQDGAFTIRIKEQYLNDTLTFSIIGYHEVKLPVNKTDTLTRYIFLYPRPQDMQEVVVSARKLTERKLGLSRTPLLHFVDASIQQNDIFEIAQLTRLGKNISKINAVNLLIEERRSDSGTFRINFYHYDGNRPAGRIIERGILRTALIKEGWLQFDLSKDGVYLRGDVIVAIEFIPTSKTSTPVKYEIKPAGGAKSFVRTSSLGTWGVPPHNYRMYITAVGTDAPAEQDEETEEETAPAFRLFSTTVNDSFSIFVRLPQNYKAKNIQNTVYLLDANLYFNYVADSLGKTGDKKTVLIGIGYKDFLQMDSLRDRDYTYPVALSEDSFSVSGGADKFYEFINNELVPYIDHRYHTQHTKRTLIGHSLGGYFTLYALYNDIVNNKRTFTKYVAASPSIEYHNDYLIEKFKVLDKSADSKKLHITWGGQEDDVDSKSKYSEIMERYFQLLSGGPFKDLKVSRMYFPGYGHMETSLPTFYNTISR